MLFILSGLSPGRSDQQSFNFYTELIFRSLFPLSAVSFSAGAGSGTEKGCRCYRGYKPHRFLKTMRFNQIHLPTHQLRSISNLHKIKVNSVRFFNRILFDSMTECFVWLTIPLTVFLTRETSGTRHPSSSQLIRGLISNSRKLHLRIILIPVEFRDLPVVFYR